MGSYVFNGDGKPNKWYSDVLPVKRKHFIMASIRNEWKSEQEAKIY